MKTFMIGVVCLAAANLAYGAGTALQFDGNDAVVIPNSASLTPSGAITIEFAVNMPSWPAQGVGLVVTKGANSSSGNYTVGFGALQDVWFSWGGWSAPIYVNKPITSSFYNAWHHVAATYDGQDAKLYLDGALASQTHWAVPTPAANSAPLDFGYNPEGGFSYYFTGMVDDVRIWNYARTGQQIYDNMWLSLDGSQQGLLGDWTFDEQQGSQVVKDLSPYHNDGVLGFSSAVESSDPTRVIPEPATMLFLGLGAVAMLRRQKVAGRN